MPDPTFNPLGFSEREALKQDFFASLHCALPGSILSFDPETQTAEIRPAVRAGSVNYPNIIPGSRFHAGSLRYFPRRSVPGHLRGCGRIRLAADRRSRRTGFGTAA